MTLNGNKVSGWAFDQNNVLSFELQAGFSAWLQFTLLPGGPLFMGTMAPSNAEGFVSDKEFQVRALLRQCHIAEMLFSILSLPSTSDRLCQLMMCTKRISSRRPCFFLLVEAVNGAITMGHPIISACALSAEGLSYCR